MRIWDIVSKTVPNYEERPSQRRLSEAIYASFMEGHHMIAEGPCGVGKSMAYLLAFVEAFPQRSKLLICTSNNTLLSQLYKKDLPAVETLAMYDQKTIDWVMLQGKQNYFCRKKFERIGFEMGQMMIPDELKEILRQIKEYDNHIKHWLGHLEDSRTHDWAKERLTIPSTKCKPTSCSHADRCELAITRAAMAESQIVCTNYHLWIVDRMLSTFNEDYMSIFGEVDAIVFDEAHELPDIARDFFSLRLSDGWVDSVTEAVQGVAAPAIREAWKAYRGAFKDRPSGGTPFLPERKVAETFLDTLQAGAAELAARAARDKKDELYEIVEKIQRILMYASDIVLGTVSSETHAYGIEWDDKDKHREPRFFIECVEISIGKTLGRIIPEDIPVIALSATMTTGKRDFSFVKSQLGMKTERTLAVESPFDMSRSAVFSFQRAADPNDDEKWIAHCAEVIHTMATQLHGRTLCLFTSTYRMNKVSDRLHAIEERRYEILCQGQSSNAHLMKGFRENKESILLGVASFWTGMDIQGDSLSAVFVERVPFLPPNDIIMQAQQKLLGKEAFGKFALPNAMIRLRQGVGRLIRSKKDFGIVVFADARMQAKAYGRGILRSILPGARLHTGGMNELGVLSSALYREIKRLEEAPL